jgi:hypothetical protein
LDRFAVSSLRSPESGHSCPRTVTAARTSSPRVFASYGVLCAILVALSSTSSAIRPRIPCLSELFPGSPVPSASRQKFILPWSGSLAEFLATSWLSGLSVGPTSLRFLVPSTASSGRAPCGRFVTPVRFRSQDSRPCGPVLSAVSWQAQSLRPCFRPHRSWDSSLQGLPLTGDRLRLSTQPGFLAVILRCAETRGSSPCHRRFPRRPRFHAVAWFPRRL